MAKFERCRAWNCDKCKHYSKYLSMSSMEMICWNKRITFEEIEK